MSEEGVLEGVIDASKARILKLFSVKVFDNGPYFQCIWNVRNPVTVWNDDGKRIGHATLFERADGLYADLFLDYATPQRLQIELGEPLYPQLDGAACSNIDNNIGSVNPLLKPILECEVWGIWLVTDKPRGIVEPLRMPA